jgi:hypothetical protein
MTDIDQDVIDAICERDNTDPIKLKSTIVRKINILKGMLTEPVTWGNSDHTILTEGEPVVFEIDPKTNRILSVSIAEFFQIVGMTEADAHKIVDALKEAGIDDFEVISLKTFFGLEMQSMQDILEFLNKEQS